MRIFFPFPYSRLDAVAHGGNPRRSALHRYSLFPVPCSLFPLVYINPKSAENSLTLHQ
ncbi:MAG: hypothetical protein F6K55_30970 [Moorea sp. SIO4A3]|nr:hypothetical protein [Moorena sp. SIO4A3]